MTLVSVSCIQFRPHRLSVDFRPDICPCGGVVPLGPHLDLRCTAPSIHSSLLWDSLCHLSPRHPPACPWGFAGRYSDFRRLETRFLPRNEKRPKTS